MSMLARARPDLRDLVGYSSARMEASGGRVWLNANESPWPVRDDAGDALNRYPDPQPAELRERLATLYNVAAEQVLVGRGSDEAIDLLTRAFCRAGIDEVLIAPPTFGMYAVCANVQGARVVRVPLIAEQGFAYPFDAVRAAVNENTRLVYVCNPNNPTGSTTSREDILRLARDLAGRAMVVVDEAYLEFSDLDSVATALRDYENLAVLRTLSKAHGLAGARIGVLIAAPEVIAFCRRLMAPYPLPVPCVTAALAALTPAALAITREHIARTRDERTRLARALAGLPGVRAVLPSAGNFVVARFDDAAGAYRRLLARGVVVRDVTHYPGLADALRITVGLREENDAVIDVLSRDEVAV